jgi:hypothetical protein
MAKSKRMICWKNMLPLLWLATVLSLVFPVFALSDTLALLTTSSATEGCEKPVWGPENGKIGHPENPEGIGAYSPGVSVRNFIAEATFINPYSSEEGGWDYGFLFRFAEGTSYAIQFTSSGMWFFILYTEEPSTLDSGFIDLQTGADEKNHIRIIVLGSSGAFYVNGQFVATLDTSQLTKIGDVSVATGIGVENKKAGKVTSFKNFTIWSLDTPTSGPSTYNLKNENNSRLSTANVNLRDFIAEATFSNLYSPDEGEWNYGFLFRVTDDTSYAIQVSSDNAWNHDLITGGKPKTIGLGKVRLRTGIRQLNQLRIIAIGTSGWFYVNDQLVATLDISELTGNGDVGVTAKIPSDDEIEGKITRCEGFSVWSMDGCPELSSYALPDRDRDGIPDNRDKCYNPGCGIVDSDGCPKDSDGDGVTDCEDACPNEQGEESLEGCPEKDKDNDGVPDDEDSCYNPECNIVDSQGCPLDSDGDGVTDCEDECPNEQGEEGSKGCPDKDKDNDGVPDNKDKCDDPDCGIVGSDGCPLDSDSDGVNDCDDLCLLKKGKKENDGCPSSMLPFLLSSVSLILIPLISLIAYKRAYIKSRLFPSSLQLIHPNPYVAGNPVRDQSMFFGRTDVFEFIKNKLSVTRKNITIVLYGERRTGKTSVLYQIENGKLGKEFVPVYIDLQEMAKVNEREFFAKISGKIMEALIKFKIITPKSTDYNDINKIMSLYETESNPYTVFTGFLDKVSATLKEKYFIVMFDEYEILEKKIKSDHLSPDLIQYLRNLMQNRERFSFVFAGSKKLEELEGIHWSLMFNLATYKKIGFLERKDALDLMKIPVNDKIQYGNEVVDKLLRLTACHPYFLQLFLQNVVDHMNESKKNSVGTEELTHVMQYILDNPSPHMFYIWKDSTYEQQMVLSALAGIIESENQYISIKEVYEKLLENGATLDKKVIRNALNDVTRKDILERKKGEVTYSFKIDLLRYWIESEYPLFRVIEEA